MPHVLFVCTGNIFRSLTAEYAVRRELLKKKNPGWHADFDIASAGTVDFPHVVRPEVRDYLMSKGLDVSAHRRRTLTRAIAVEADIVIAMNTDHQAFIRQRFKLDAPLYTEACGETPDALPDVEDVIPDYTTNAAAVTAHLHMTIDRIIALAPGLAARLAELPREGR